MIFMIEGINWSINFIAKRERSIRKHIYLISTNLRVSLMHALKYFKLSIFVALRGMSVCERTLQISSYANICFSGCNAN